MKFTIKARLPSKAIIGLIILVIALALFLVKNQEKDDWIDISNDDPITDEQLEDSDSEDTAVIEETIVVELADKYIRQYIF